MHLNGWIYQVPALLAVSFRLWLLNYLVGVFVFIYDDVSVYLEHLETKTHSSQKKGLRFISQLPSAVKHWDSCEWESSAWREGPQLVKTAPDETWLFKKDSDIHYRYQAVRSSVQSPLVWSLNCFPWTHLHWFDKSCSVCRPAEQQTCLRRSS